MVTLQFRMMDLATLLSCVLPISSQVLNDQTEVGVVGAEAEVGVMVSQIVRHQLAGCHLVVLTTTQHSHVFYNIIRHLSEGMVAGVVVVEAEWVFSLDHLLQGLWGDSKTTCRGLILDITAKSNATSALELLESTAMWKSPETLVVVVGWRSGVKAVLLHHTLRNSVHALYLALQSSTVTRNRNTLRKTVLDQQSAVESSVWVYRRCLYCNNGKADVKFIKKGNFSLVFQEADSLFPDQFKNLMGHQFRIVSVQYFPYIDYERDTNLPGTTVTLSDSLDARLLDTFSASMNFTYEIREERERSWGREQQGNFNGIMGKLQREEADFSTMASMTAERLRVMKHASAYDSDILTLVSLKPTLLPEHLSLIRPFAGELWCAVVVIVAIWTVILWLLQRTWGWVVGKQVFQFNDAFMYGWGLLMEQPPPRVSFGDSGRLLVGGWLVFCLVITTGYRSSLVAHLTVQGRSLPIDTFEDMVALHGRKWGIESWILKGVPYDYLSKHTHTVVKKVYKEMEVLEVTEGLKKVLAGKYTYISMKNHLTVIITSRYADARGQIPFYISQRGVYSLPDYGWGFRKGAPFFTRFSYLMTCLKDTGIMTFWTNDVIAKSVKKTRDMEHLKVLARQQEDDSQEVVLDLYHVQGAFYLMFLGYSIAFLTLLGEKLSHCLFSTK